MEKTMLKWIRPSEAKEKGLYLLRRKQDLSICEAVTRDFVVAIKVHLNDGEDPYTYESGSLRGLATYDGGYVVFGPIPRHNKVSADV